MADQDQTRDAVEGGNYEVIRARLGAQGDKLFTATEALNARRAGTFGSTGLKILGNERIRTENNCIPCDLVQVGGSLLLGYNVFLGLKKQTVTDDVFSLQRFEVTDEGVAFHAVTDERRLSFLTDRNFVREFEELYQYYKDARLIQLRVTETKLLAVFQTGATFRDFKVLRWAVDPGGSVTYIDNRGERDHTFPATHDFEWKQTSRSDHILGRHPHVNILDTVFVETVGGDLTVKVEDNTQDGQGIYSEPVDDRNQSLDDADIQYARLGALILLKIKPFQEKAYRYLVYNANTRHVVRIDAIGQSCVSLPEDHGILFPGGYYLRTGEYKVFDDSVEGLQFVRRIPSPNGEDVLFVFMRRQDGLYALYPYNLIRKEIATPVSANGYSLFDDGTLVVFRAAAEPTRVHPVQIWKTPFVSAEHHQQQPTDGSLLSRIGNKDLVRGISDAFTLVRLIRNQEPTRAMYEELVQACNRFVDAYYWVGEREVGDLRALADEIRRTAELIIDEFVKVQTLKATAKAVLKQVESEQSKLMTDLRPEYFQRVDEFLGAMTRLRGHRGHLITLKETRYVDVARLDQLEEQVVARFDQVSRDTVEFLLGDKAFDPLRADLDGVLAALEAVHKATELPPLQEKLDTVTEGVNLLGEVLAGLDVEDPTQKTAILEGVSEVVAHANRVRAVLDQRRRSLRSSEGKAEFAAQFKLYGQSVASALAMSNAPEACDEQLSRMLLQLEELEARFGEFDEFLPELAAKREEVYEAFGSRKQTLLDERQRRVGSLMGAAERILGGVERRARTFKTEEELASWFAADPMVMKLRQLAEQLADLGDTVKSDEVQARLKTARTDALRALRDKLDLFEGGEDLVKLGKHRFTFNTQPLELTLMPHGEALALHLNGTDYLEPIDDPEFEATRPYWDQTVISEDAEVYRSEYLAHSLLTEREAELDKAVLSQDKLLELVRAHAADRFEESYDRGIHDADAALILGKLIALRQTAGLLRFSSAARTLAVLFWSFAKDKPVDAWKARARALGRLQAALGPSPEVARFCGALATAVRGFHEGAGFDPDGAWTAEAAEDAARYLFEVLSHDPVRFTFSHAAEALRDGLNRWLEDHGGEMTFEDALKPLGERWDERFTVKQAWLETFARAHHLDAASAREAAALLLCVRFVDVDVAGGSGETEVAGLLGQHARVKDGKLWLRLDEFLARLRRFREQRVPGFRRYRQQRTELVERERRRLRVDEYKPKVMSAFVRNQLINDVYLPIVGDNLAKQLGAAGDNKRTDLMGLLLLVSPPGYGKTTLMEYVANRLGLTFVKVNGPALGHEVTSLDPGEAPNATARQEVEKVSLALEMGNNVMLYLDDIQHCNPEFLQKFISLCDAQRRIEGVWKGRTRTYDMRGKKFCVVMAGNPYTESGDKFQIPDMLANRADTYNLGDILGGREQQFALSFIENALTSNPALQPLATRPQADVYKLVRMARGEEVHTSELSHDYSAVELNEILAVLKHLFRCQAVLLKVNAEYIRSAAMEDAYRTEPKFQLQGSYRNMNKLAEKVVAAMNDTEVEQLITDHYQGESQTLTTGAESNLLKLGELRGVQTPEQKARWAQIKEEFARQQLMGGKDDPASKITGVLTGVAKGIGSMDERLSASVAQIVHALSQDRTQGFGDALQGIQQSLDAATHAATAAIAKPPPPPAPAPALDLGPLLVELQAIRMGLAKIRASAPAGAPVVVDADAPTPLRAPAREKRPASSAAAEVAKTRELLLQQARAALSDNGEGRIEPNGNATLAAALSVIEALTVHMAAAAQARLPADQHESFVDDLKRSVATAVTDLANGVAGK